MHVFISLYFRWWNKWEESKREIDFHRSQSLCTPSGIWDTASGSAGNLGVGSWESHHRGCRRPAYSPGQWWQTQCAWNPFWRFSTSEAWESWRPGPSPRAKPNGFEGAGNTMPVSHIPTLICWYPTYPQTEMLIAPLTLYLPSSSGSTITDYKVFY